VPLLRYFGYVGGILLTLLFAANWIWPAEPRAPASAASAESSFGQMIRIKSARRWPEKIVFDTNQPTIVPPAPLANASPPPPPPVVAANSPLDARAELKPAAPPKRQAKVRRRGPRPDSYNQRQEAWQDPWHDPWHDPRHDHWRNPHTFASAGQTPSWPFGKW
jgi:hypothetical protein